MVATKAAAAATVSGGSSFAEKLSICQRKISELETEISGIDESLATGSVDDSRALNVQRRAAVDDLTFLQERLPALEREASNEQWENKRDALNNEWSPLAVKRQQAEDAYNSAVDVLLTRFDELCSVCDQQTALLSRYQDIDRVVVGRSPVGVLVQQCRNSSPAKPDVKFIAGGGLGHRERVLP